MTTPTLGAAAPDFTLKNQHNQDVTLSSFRGEKNVLLVFYPLAFSGICSGELCSLRDDLPRITDDNVEVLTVSVDSVFAHKVWAEQENFGFSLLSDFWPHGAVAQQYGVFDENKGIARRGSFLIDKEGIIRWSVVNDIPVAREQNDYLKAIAALNEAVAS
ncbi:MAG: peroxiredoxin [Corynebacteriales bacterium]|nr:peroxiredoxin [Mycobacteriales bacterium]